MTIQFSMAEALRLTRAGNLMEATALLQGALGNSHRAATRPTLADGDVIDLVPEQVMIKAPRPPRGETSTGAAFDDLTYRGAEGSMGYRLYRPAHARAGMPLVVMLHGCTQSPEDFARGTAMNRLADELGFLVAYPRQSQAAHPQKCWNWFRLGDQRRDQGEPALLAGITRSIIADHRIDPDRVYVAGLSAGGGAAAVMAAEYPDIYAAVGIHSGIACGAARDLPTALAAMRGGLKARPARAGRFVPVITFHGDRDAIVHEANSREIVAAATAAIGVALDVRTETGRSAAGRRYERQLSRDPDSTVMIERWTIAGAGHAWSGGDASGSYTDPNGPEASREMLRFFLERKRGAGGGTRSTRV